MVEQLKEVMSKLGHLAGSVVVVGTTQEDLLAEIAEIQSNVLTLLTKAE